MSILRQCYRNDYRVCCCPEQPKPTEAELDEFVKRPELHLDGLCATYREERDILHIRMTIYQKVIFRTQKCAKSGLTCCGTCSVRCRFRCPQDVLYRAKLLAAPIMHALDKDEAYRRASTVQQMMYDELVSERPRYKVIYAMIQEYINPRKNKALRDSIMKDYGGDNTPMRLDYAPVVEFETYVNQGGKEITRRKVDPSTGNILIRNWPQSGLCPYCLPTTTVDRHKRTIRKEKK